MWVSIVIVVVLPFFVTVHAASSMAGEVRRSARLSIGWSSVMTVVAVAAPFRVQRFDNAAGQDQADEGQQKQAHDDFLRLDDGR